jgi:hypothetical protein
MKAGRAVALCKMGALRCYDSECGDRHDEKSHPQEDQVFCPQCGTQAIDGAKFCAGCGGAVGGAVAAVLNERAVVEARSSASVPRWRLNPAMLATLGLVVGGFVGFQMRPSVMFIGQLPFQTVITRGSGLRGIDQILISTAQQSFNVMFVGALIGAALASGIALLVNNRR